MSVGRVGKYLVIRSKAYPSLVLEIEDGADQPHAPVALGELSGTSASHAHQLWYVDVDTATIRNKLNQFCLSVNADGGFIVSPYVADNRSQNWVVTDGDDHVRSKEDQERVLGSAADQLPSNGARITVVSFKADSPNQQWIIDYQPPCYFYIKSYDDPKMVLDVQGADRKPGAKVIVYVNKGDLADNQLWYEDQIGVLHCKLTGFVIDASGKTLMMLPLDATNKRQQWIVNGSLIQNRFNPREVLQFKAGGLFSQATPVPVERDPSTAETTLALWKFEYIPDQGDSLNHSGCGKHFVIRSRLNGLVLEVESHPTEPGSRGSDAGSRIVAAYMSKDSALIARQQFYADDVTGTIRNTLRNHCIDIVDNVAVLVAYDPYRKMQQWRVCGKKIQNRHNMDQVLQLAVREGEGEGLGMTVSAGVYSGEEQQHWESMHTPARCFYIVSQMNDKVLDVAKDNASAGAPVILFDRKALPSMNQLWYEDDRSIIRSKLNGYVLDSSGDMVRTRPHDPSNRNHEWIIVGDRIQNKYDNRIVLDVLHKNTSNGATLIEHKFNGGENQRWKFDYVSL